MGRPESREEEGPRFRLAYNTNGLAHHRLDEALELVAEIGYRGVALTPDVGQLDPYRLQAAEVRRIGALARGLDLALTLESGGRYLLDPRRKHRPNLLEAERGERARRLDLLERSLALAAELGAGVLSLWSGVLPEGVERARAFDHLAAGLEHLLDAARGGPVRLAFEPEPGMLVEDPAGWRELRSLLGGRASELGLCLDLGHLVVTGDLPVERVIADHAAELVHVHLDDARPHEHVHRMFGEGELDLRAALRALAEIDYSGQAAVELSRDAHRGADAAREAFAHLRAALSGPPGPEEGARSAESRPGSARGAPG